MADGKMTPARPFGELRRTGDKWILRFSTGEGRERLEVEFTRLSEEAREERRATIASLVKEARANGTMGLVPFRLALEAIGTATTAARLESMTRAARTLACGNAAPVPVAVASSVPTLLAFAESWIDGSLAKRYPSQVRARRSDSGIANELRTMLAGKVGATPIDKVDLDVVQRALDNIPADRMASTKHNYGAALKTLLAYAAWPCRYLVNSPMVTGVVPKAGKRRAMTFLRPAEEAQYLGCTKVPIEWRIWTGFMCREGLRLGEASELRWQNLDLDLGTIRMKSEKTSDWRVWSLDPSVRRALTIWREMTKGEPGELVFTNEHGRQFTRHLNAGTAAVFRRLLLVAGVDRREIHNPGQGAVPLRVHDCRSTFATISLACSKPERWVQDRTGHSTSAMLGRYYRSARLAEELHLGPLAELDRAIPELAKRSGFSQELSQDSTEKPEKAPSCRVVRTVSSWHKKRSLRRERSIPRFSEMGEVQVSSASYSFARGNPLLSD